MRTRSAWSAIVVVAYALLLGHVAWYTFSSPVRPDHRTVAAWRAPWITRGDGDDRRAYFRKTFSLRRPPVHAWIAVMAPDAFDLYVNGQHLGSRSFTSGHAQAVFDLTGVLVAGPNVVAVRNRVDTYPQRARVVVEGQAVEGEGAVVDLRSDAGWRTAGRDESLVSRGLTRRVSWSSPVFDDGAWPFAVEGPVPDERAVQAVPAPRDVFGTVLRSPWAWSPEAGAAEVYARLVLDLAERPREAWVRIAARTSFRLLVNGDLVAIAEDTVGVPAPGALPLRLYGVGSFLRRGRNVIAVQAAGETGDRGLVLDGFVRAADGPPRWFSVLDVRTSTRVAAGWTEPAFDDATWRPAAATRPVTPAEAGGLVKDLATVQLQPGLRLRRTAGAAAVLGAVVLAALLEWALVARVLARISRTPPSRAAAALSLAFLPAALGLGAASALRFEPRLWPDLPYQPGVVGAGVAAALGAQALLLGAALWRRGTTSRATRARARGAPAWWRLDAGLVAALGLAAVGFVLRFQDLTRQSLIVDEVTGLTWTTGVLDRLYPSMLLDGRVKPATTSELVYVFKAITVGLLGPNALGLRLHDVVFGTLTIPLLYVVGTRLHGRAAGLLAAALYTVLPSTIGMTHYGRYPSQQQFFALLTLGLLVRAFQAGRPHPRTFALAVAAFIATYLSWEGAALFLPALAVGVAVLTRPDLSWVKSRHVWTGLGVIGGLVFLQLVTRFVLRAEWRFIGTGAQEVAPALMWRYPFYQPGFYISNFFVLETQHLVALVFALGIPLWFRRSREGRVLGLLGWTVVTDLVLMTNFLQLQHWRYVYYLFPLVLLAVAQTLVMASRRLHALARASRTASPATGALARLATASAITGVLVFSTTLVVRLENVPGSERSIHTRRGAWTFAELAGAAEFVQAHAVRGEVVIAGKPSVVQIHTDLADYHLQTRLIRPLMLGSDPGWPIHHAWGGPTILSLAELRTVLDRARGAWLVTSAGETEALDRETLLFVRRSMRKVYEDVESTVYYFGPGRGF